MMEKGVEGKTISYLAIRAQKAVGGVENCSVCWARGLGKMWPLVSDLLV